MQHSAKIIHRNELLDKLKIKQGGRLEKAPEGSIYD